MKLYILNNKVSVYRALRLYIVLNSIIYFRITCLISQFKLALQGMNIKGYQIGIILICRSAWEGSVWDGRIGMRWKDGHEIEGLAWDGRIGMRWKDRLEMEGSAWDGRIGMRWKDWHEMEGLAWDGRIGMRWKDRLEMEGSAWDGRIGLISRFTVQKFSLMSLEFLNCGYRDTIFNFDILLF